MRSSVRRPSVRPLAAAQVLSCLSFHRERKKPQRGREESGDRAVSLALASVQGIIELLLVPCNCRPSFSGDRSPGVLGQPRQHSKNPTDHLKDQNKRLSPKVLPLFYFRLQGPGPGTAPEGADADTQLSHHCGTRGGHSGDLWGLEGERTQRQLWGEEKPTTGPSLALPGCQNRLLHLDSLSIALYTAEHPGLLILNHSAVGPSSTPLGSPL